MKKFENKEAALASQNFDPSAVVITGVPEHHLEAVKGFINLCVGHDAVNPEFNPDYTNYDQYKYEAIHDMGSPSGAGFSYVVYDIRGAGSGVGARLVSEDSEAAEHIAEIFHEDYKAMKVYDRSAIDKIQK
ncbi:hypothetical protein G4D82_10525 [Flavobacterium sp. CYK-4]|uniref:hypothetical protein n=1 Tax=Flavobacterium lotistagni TaxID=2709660 RepID=UPI00140B7DDC|nr:hypothetical protein [Flavobacterium lotistagni]NHM07658.1 hypothetical protein [Flavobacterium lotistagni]